MAAVHDNANQTTSRQQSGMLKQEVRLHLQLPARDAACTRRCRANLEDLALKFLPTLLATAIGASCMPPATAENVLSGDARLACEALLCLATSGPPSECAESIARYFTISLRKWSDTVRARSAFLGLCPLEVDADMPSLVQAIANGAGRCDAASLNVSNALHDNDRDTPIIDNRMPPVCTAYFHNAYVDMQDTSPRYVGTPERQGLWIETAQYEDAQRNYDARLAAEAVVQAAAGAQQ